MEKHSVKRANPHWARVMSFHIFRGVPFREACQTVLRHRGTLANVFPFSDKIPTLQRLSIFESYLSSDYKNKIFFFKSNTLEN